jgi:cyclase
MITKRIIPCLDIKDNKVVKGVQFKNLQVIEDPVTLAKYYANSLADELVLYDISASKENKETIFDLAKKVAKEIQIPFTIGGGIKSIAGFDEALKSGADKVSINSAAINNPELITQASKKFGAQCVVLSIDAKLENGVWEVYSKGGSQKENMNALEWAITGEKLGAGEIVFNSINADGEKKGFSEDILKELNNHLSIPIIASGGAGCKEDFLTVFKNTDVDAALAASVFHKKEIAIKDLKVYLRENNIEVRL